MAKLNPVLIESLTNDLEELHITCKTMLADCDEYDVISWKYPDKFCKDIEINIDKDEHEEVEQYILLLELIIDRLYFIINISTHILDSLPMLSSIFCDFRNCQLVNDVSLGILISLFWKRLQVLMYLNETPQKPTKSESLKLECKYSQTETCSFSTCESCHMFIDMMKNLINKVQQSTTIVESPSAISETRKIMERDVSKVTQLKAMQQWVAAIITDINTLTEFFQKHSSEHKLVTEKIDKLKKQKQVVSKKLAELKNKCSDLEEAIKSSEFKMGTLTKSHSILEQKYNNEHETLASLQETQNINLSQIVELKSQINKINSENEKVLCEIKMEHLSKMENLTSQRDHWVGLYATNVKYTEELDNKFIKLKVKYENLEKMYENDISEERNKSVENKTKLEEQERKHLNHLEELEKELNKEKSQYKEVIENLEENVEKLNVEIKKFKDRELALVKSPDLNGPLTYLPTSKLDPIADMENQMNSNKIRIEILQTQNVNLQRTVDKLRLLSAQHN